MLHNHGWEKQQIYDQKGQDPKGIRQAKTPTKKNPAVGQKDHFKCIWPAKKKQPKLNYKNNNIKKLKLCSLNALNFGY